MKKLLKSTFTTVILTALLMTLVGCLISCGNNSGNETKEPMTDVSTSGMDFVSGMYKVTVEPEVPDYNLASKLTVSDGATIFYSKSEKFDSSLNGNSIELNPGENIIYAKVVDKNGFEKIHMFNIYKKQVFTVSFDTVGGTTIEPISVKEGTVIQAPSTVKSGYSFDGWSYDFSKPITSSLNVKAKWKANQYTIKLSVDSSYNEISVTYGEDYDLSTFISNKIGYTFIGLVRVYENQGEKIEVTFEKSGKYAYASDIVVEAKYQPTEYSITYVLVEGATNLNTATSFTVENSVVLLDAIWKDDEKKFAGWYLTPSYDESSKIEVIENLYEKIKLYAKFEDVVFVTNVTLNAKEEVAEDAYKFTYKAPYELAIPNLGSGYVFNGWYYLDKNNQKQPIGLSGNWMLKDESITLIADYYESTQNIEYFLNGGTNNQKNPSKFSPSDGEVELLAPSYGNNIFMGWYSDPEFANQIKVLTWESVENGIILYAKWQYVSNVNFDLSGANIEAINSLMIKYGETIDLPTLVNPGYVFVGWYYGDTEIVNGSDWNIVDAEVTLKAQWVPNTIAINYVLNGGTQNENNKSSVNANTGIVTLYDPTKEHSIFVGWFTDIAFTNQISEIDTTKVTEITLYAKWMDENVHVTYNPNGASVSTTEEVIAYGSQYHLVTPELLGYNFEGWYYNGQIVPVSGKWTILDDNVTLVAKWIAIEYTIEYQLGAYKYDDLVTSYTVNSDEIILPILNRNGYIFLGWESDGVVSRNVVIPKGSTGDKKYKATWCSDTDAKGFVYELEGDHMVVVKYVKEVDDTQIVYMPREYSGYPVTTIRTNAFTEFGVAFGKSEYKNASYYYTICIPKSITLIEKDAFESCNGICISLYKGISTLIDSTKSEDLQELLDWESNVRYSIVTKLDSNQQVRDCIWGFRPALGWSRYSAVDIPDFYE